MPNIDISAHNHVEINKEEEMPGVEQFLKIMPKLTLMVMSICEKNTTQKNLNSYKCSLDDFASLVVCISRILLACLSMAALSLDAE